MLREIADALETITVEAPLLLVFSDLHWVDPRSQIAKAFCGVLVKTGVGPLANGSLDEAFGLAIGGRSVDASAGMSDLEMAAGLCEPGGTEARTIVAHDATDRDAEVGEVGHGLAEEAAGRGRFFIRQQGGEGDAGVVIDGDIKKLPAGAAAVSSWGLPVMRWPGLLMRASFLMSMCSRSPAAGSS